MRKLILGMAVPVALLAAGAAVAAKKPADEDYGRNLISVATPGRHAPSAQTGACVVWINAEGLGVGPAQLDGLHGLSLTINVKPLPGEATSNLASGIASAKAEHPKAPAWLFTALEKHRAAIEAGCAEDHEDPVKVTSLTAKDKS
jgi:hypothetical protein